MGSSLGPNFSSICEWQPGGSRIGVKVSTVHGRGFLQLDFQVDGKPIVQRFELTGILMQVGGVRWTVKCPESGKMVRDLYLCFPTHLFSFAPCLASLLPYEQAERTSSGTCQ